MAFDPDEYLNEKGTSSTAKAEFDPDAYLSESKKPAATFDPDAYLSEVRPPTIGGLTVPPAPEAPKPRPIVETIGQLEGIKNAAMNAFDSSRQAMAVAGGVSPEEAEDISKLEYQKEARKLSPAYSEYLQAEGMDAVKAFAKNPFEITTNIVAEGLAGSLYSIGAGVAAGGVAAAATAATGVGAPLAPAAFLGGQIGGTFAGSLATEYGGKVLEELQNAGMDIKDPESIQKFFSDEKLMEGARSQALKRGVPVAIFDGVSAGIGGRLARLPIQALTKTPTRLAVTEAVTQAALGGGGEIAGALAAGEEIQPKAVFGEVIGEVGPAAAEITVGRIAERLAKTPEQKQFDQNVLAAQVATRASQDVAPASADALERQVQDTMASAAETPEERVVRLQKEAKAGAGIELEEETANRFFESARSIVVPQIRQIDPDVFRTELNTIETRIAENAFTVADLDQTQFKTILSPEAYTQISTLFEENPQLAAQTLRQVIERELGIVGGGGGEGEPPVTGLPPVEPTPPVTPTPETAVAPVEPVVPAEVTLPPAIEEVAPEERENIVALPPAETLPETPTPEGQRWDTTPPSATLPKELENRNDIVNKLPELTTREAMWLDLSLHEVSNNLAEKSRTRKNWVDDLKENSRRKQPLLESLQTGERMTPKQAQEALEVIRESKQIHSDYATGKYRGSTARGNQQWHNAWLNKYNEIEAELISNYPELAAPEAAPAALEPTPVTPPVTPQLEPLRRVARAEQTEEDVAGLVDGGLAELYKGQPVLTQAGLDALPEAERPRLTPEARKIQIDTRTSEAAAEAISKNLRIGVDQVPVDVRMPSGWTLEGDVYVPPQPQEVGQEFTVYRGELPALEGGRQLAGIRDVGELMGIPDSATFAPFTYYSTSEQDARAYLERDAQILRDYQQRFGNEEGLKMFQSLHGFDPRTEGQMVSKKIRPRKVFDMTEMGTVADQFKMTELIAKERGVTLPENWTWRDVPAEVQKEISDYGLDIVGDPDKKDPTWQYFRNTTERTRAALIARGLSQRTKEDVRGSLFAQWLRKNGYDAVAMMHETDQGPVKHLLVINEEAAKAQEGLAQPQAQSPTPEVREARREPPVEIQQQYAPKTDEEQQSFDRASTNKILARSPQLAVAAVRLKNGEITAGEYADLVDVLDPFVVKGAEPVPTNEKIYQYMSQTAGGKPTSEQGKEKLSKIGVFKKDGTQRIPNGKLAEFRIDIPTYNESTKNGDTVYSITGHEPVSETATQVGKTIAHLGIAKITNPQFITRTISGKGDAIQIAMGAGKFPLATVKGNYEAITELPADINDPNVWTETGYNPVRSSELVDVRSKKALVGGTEAIMVGSRVFVKNAQLEARPTGVTMGERYARRVQMGRAGMEQAAVEARLQELGFPTGGIIRVVNEPDADFEGRTIILDGKVTGIELNAAALKDNAAIDRVLNHEFAESANADGALNKLVERLTPKEKKEINDTITRLRYEERARTSEEAARAIEALAEAWKGRGFFTRAVARAEAWASKLGFKLTRRAAEYIAARNLADINAGFRTAYNRFINVKGEAREGRAFVTPEENARFLELAKDPEANREELQRMVEDAATKAGYNQKWFHGTASEPFNVFSDMGRGGFIYFAQEPNDAMGWAENAVLNTTEENAVPRVVDVFIRAKNIFDRTNKNHFNKVADLMINSEERLLPKRQDGTFQLSGESPKDIRKNLLEGNWEWYEDIAGRFIRQAGFDGAYIFESQDFDPYNLEMADLGILNPNLIKLADPVTYDDQGNVIPLEQRFQPTSEDIRYARREVRESRREPEAIPTFTEGTPEAATLKEMATSMSKVDAASEAKGGKPETYKISEIASVWMDSGLGERELQDAIVEYTNLTPANAARVAKAIARQYDIQQSIATAFLETQTGLSVEALPEGVTLPKEVDPDRPKPVMQRLFEVFMGVRVPPVKITGNEKTLLKQQIRLKAAANRAAKEAQKETAAAVIETIKQMELRGPVRQKQAQALAKRAANVIWTSEKSVEAFTEYAAKVVENTNYDADVREAKAAQKRAKELSKQKTVAASPQRQVLEDIGKISIVSIDDPRLFADTVNYYLRAFKKVTSPDYVVIPDSEMTSYLSQLENQEIDTNAERERVSNEKLAAQYGLPVSQVEALLNSQDIIRDLVAYAKREEIESILNQKIGDIQTALKAYDQNQLRPDQRKLVDSLLAIDAKGLDAKEKQSLIRIGNNVIYNNQTNGAQYFVAVANGQQNARQAAQDFKTIEKNRAWIDLIPTLGSKRAAETMRNWSLELQSVADTFRNIFGKESMAKIFRQMGMYNLDRGFTDAANTLDQIQEKMAEFYKKNTQKYKKAARDQNGILSEGVVGFLIQQVPAKGEAESIAQRRDLIKQDIANRRSSRQADKMEMADRIEEILGKVDGNTVEEILANMKASYRPSYDSLTYLMNDLLPQYKDFLKQFDENFNDQANNYDNPYYLPIAFIRSGPELEITPESESMFYEGMSLRPRQAANTIKRVDYSVLPKDKSGNPKEIQFNLRRGTYDSLSDQINKAYTNEAWQQIFSFMKTADADAVFGGRANKDFMAERLNRLRISRMRRGSANNGAISKFADSISVLARKIGTGIALGGVFQVFKQSPDQLISALGTTGRYDLLGEHVMTIGSAKKLLDKFSIGRRGDASSGYKYINQMEGAQNRLERAFTESRWSEVKENASKVADVWMLALKKTDFLCAAGAWMTYYRANLDKNGIKFEGWDKEAQLVDTDPSRQDAASYAEQMTDIYQGSSDPTKMATFAQSGKSGWENFVKAALVPFNSFAVQQRMRIYSDGRDSFTKAGETGALGRFGLASTIGGLVAFHTMRRLVLPTITGAGVYALYGMLGVDMDEPDDEKKKEEARKAWRQFQGELLANTLVGGAPQFVEAATIDAFNYANYLVSLQLESEDIIDDNGEIMDFSKYQKERSPFWRYQSFKNAPSFGMFDVGLGQAEKVAVQTKQLMDREQMEMYTPEEQRLLYFSTLSEWLYLMRLNDADLARMVGKARRDMIKAVEDREKQIKAIREVR